MNALTIPLLAAFASLALLFLSLALGVPAWLLRRNAARRLELH